MPRVREMTPDDWPAVREVYLEGIATGVATFETQAPAWSDWDRAHLPRHRLVAVEDEADDVVLGWVACSATSSRAVYAGVVELSVYVTAAARGRGVGSALLAALIPSAEADGIWTLQSSVSALNSASIALHEKHGFRRVGVRERLGRLGDVWHDIVLLERRSAVAGT
ncbi:MAG: GCN5-related N-acetyltransferase [Actinotalea sp.]|nr:GCN5-related N-acetyltransferase [Actinotalea sp.]